MNDTTTLHDRDWEAHAAEGFQWQDPNDPQKKRLALQALSRLGPPGRVQMLDFGCGNGALTSFFHASGYQVQGVDISGSVIQHNRRRFPEIQFETVPPGKKLPFADGSFDAIFCAEVIEHLYDVNLTFGELSRVLRSGGLLILTTPYHGLIKNVVIALFFFDRHFDPNWQHIRFWSKKSLNRTCAAHHLQPIAWRYIGRLWPVPKSFFVTCRKRL